MKKVGGLILILVGLAAAVFWVAPLVGDRFLLADRFKEAGIFYGLRADPKRLLALQLAQTERQYDSEETGLSTASRVLSQPNQKVLGATVTVPVLMYHYIRVNPDPNDRVGFNLSVTPGSFADQMKYLANHGYNPVSLDDLESAIIRGGILPEKPVVITFDDGYRDCFLQAFPVLQQYHFKAINFIITGLVGAPNYLTWEQIKVMADSGLVTFGAHTVHHIALTYSSDSRVSAELLESKADLEKHLGTEIFWFAYPYGNVDDRVSKIVRASGFVGAFGTNSGTYQDLDKMYTLPRVRVGGGDSVASFAAKLPWK